MIFSVYDNFIVASFSFGTYKKYDHRMHFFVLFYGAAS